VRRTTAIVRSKSIKESKGAFRLEDFYSTINNATIWHLARVEVQLHRHEAGFDQIKRKRKERGSETLKIGGTAIR
jgi:hypothetical protein